MSGHPLDNPTWHALTGRQAGLAEGAGRARRFRRDVSMFAAIADDTPAAWDELAAISNDSPEVIVNRVGNIAPPPGWTVLGGGPGFQMVLTGEPTAVEAAAVTAAVARAIRAAGNTPVLHVAEPNIGAKRVYEQLGFEIRTVLLFTALRAPRAR